MYFVVGALLLLRLLLLLVLLLSLLIFSFVLSFVVCKENKLSRGVVTSSVFLSCISFQIECVSNNLYQCDFSFSASIAS